MNNKGIAHFLINHAAKGTSSFHMPGHKGDAIYRENGYGDYLDIMMNCDITEIHGADNLFQYEGIVDEVMEKYRKLYNSKRSYLLVNGSSCGLIAAILTSVPRGGKLIMARNSHKSIFNALMLSDITPVYLHPSFMEEYGISGEITAEEVKRCIESAPDASAIILPSPNYYGICSDIKAIAELAHKHNMTLIIDEAHGAHLKFFEDGGYNVPGSAGAHGADIVINSIHKTLASLTQSALLSVYSDRVDLVDLDDKLQMIESSSPSYLLMASLDINAEILENRGEEYIERWMDNLYYFYSEAEKIEGLRVLSHPMLDSTKLNLDMSRWGLSGAKLEIMLQEYGIYSELCTGNILMCMSGIGNTKYDFERLIDGLKSIVRIQKASGVELGDEPMAPPAGLTQTLELRAIPRKKERVRLHDAEGRVCAQSVIPYPPGIPLVCPGEVFTKECIDYIIKWRASGEKVIGVDSEGRVACGLD